MSEMSQNNSWRQCYFDSFHLNVIDIIYYTAVAENIFDYTDAPNMPQIFNNEEERLTLEK